MMMKHKAQTAGVVGIGGGESDATVCYVWTLNNIGGIETLLVRHGCLHKAQGRPARLITCEGPMEAAYREVFELVILLRRHELDLPCLDDAEFEQTILSIAARLADGCRYHFVFFNHLGAYIAARLAAMYEGSTTTLYILEDRILAPSRLEFVERMNQSGMVIAMNEACVAGHRELYGYDLRPTPLIVPLGLDFPEIEAGRKRKSNNILTVARLHPMKEYVFGLIDALAVLATERHRPGLSLTIIGDGPLLEQLKELTRQRGVQGLVVFTGEVPPDLLDSYYNQADVFVGMGTTILEASGRGVPSIVAIGHSRKFETHGFFCDTPGYTLGEAASGICPRDGVVFLRQLIDSEQIREEVSHACRRKAVELFSGEISMRLLMEKLRSSKAAVTDVPLPTRPIRYGRLRRALKRLFRHHPSALAAGRWIRSLMGGADI